MCVCAWLLYISYVCLCMTVLHISYMCLCMTVLHISCVCLGMTVIHISYMCLCLCMTVIHISCVCASVCDSYFICVSVHDCYTHSRLRFPMQVCALVCLCHCNFAYVYVYIHMCIHTYAHRLDPQHLPPHHCCSFLCVTGCSSRLHRFTNLSLLLLGRGENFRCWLHTSWGWLGVVLLRNNESIFMVSGNLFVCSQYAQYVMDITPFE